jgi:PAS domain S-box-containing protein
MKKRSEEEIHEEMLRNKIMGLGETSMRKSYFPQLQNRIKELEKTNEQLKELITEKENARLAAAESEALLADIINYQPTGTYRLRLDKSCVLSNGLNNSFSFDFLSSKFCEILDIPCNYFDHNPFAIADVIHPEDLKSFLDCNHHAISNFTSFIWEGRINAQRKLKWVHMESHPRLLSNGDRVWTGIISDFTARKQAQEELRISEERFRLIFESSPLGIISYDDKGIIKACNNHFSNITGIEKELLLGSYIMKIPFPSMARAIKKARKGENFVFEGDFKPQGSGKTVQIRLQLANIIDYDGKVRGGMGILEDLSERLKNQKLEQEIAIARKSVEFKQNFLANMSHEIRTPLTGIEGMASILARTPLNEQQRDYLDTIISSSQSLREIINQILDYSKIEAGHMLLKPRPFKLADLINRSRSLLAALCTDQIPYKVIYPEGLPEYIEADDQKIFQIITNLISNAVKYAPQGMITLEIRQVPYPRSDKLRFMVKVIDQGPGINIEKHKDVFSPFSQLEQADKRTVEGTGLGLSISREMSRILGGTIGLESEPGHGATFWFTFMATIPPIDTFNPQELEAEKSKIQHPPLKILLVEDKMVNQKVIQLMLQGLGHTISIANNGKSAVENFNPRDYDLILMDIQMPVMDGITATHELRKKHTSLPPIVGLSANAFEGDKEKYMSLGLDDYLTKPIDMEEFSSMLQRINC